jgi:hypothetical protein
MKNRLFDLLNLVLAVQTRESILSNELPRSSILSCRLWTHFIISCIMSDPSWKTMLERKSFVEAPYIPLKTALFENATSIVRQTGR